MTPQRPPRPIAWRGVLALLLLSLLSPLGWAAGTPAAQTYLVKPGDTLDKVISQTMGDSPLRIDLLRQAFVQQNPQAFVKGSSRVLLAGRTLVVPNHDALLRQYLKPRSAAASVAGDDGERKNWIRYP